MKGLKEEGLNVQVYSFKTPDISNLTFEMKRAIRDTIYLPSLFSINIYLSHLYFIFHFPLKYFRVMIKVLFGEHQKYETFRLHFLNVTTFFRGIYLSYLLKEERNLIHIHAQFANYAAAVAYMANILLSIPYSFRNHTSYNPLIIKDKIERAQFILSISKFDKKQLIAWTDKSYFNKIKVNYLGFNLEKWSDKRDKELKSFIISVGRLVEKKGFKYLIDAAEILKKRGIGFHVKIVGDGFLRHNLKERIKNKGLEGKVEIVGFVSNREVRKLIEKASVFCLPCVVANNGDIDGIPFTLMESMALEKPVISTDISGIPELIDDGQNGILISPRDSLALANALEKLLKNPKLRRRLAKSAREKVEIDFNMRNNIKMTADIFRKYLN